MFVYVCFVLCVLSDWFCGLTWQKAYIREGLKYAFAYDPSLTVLHPQTQDLWPGLSLTVLHPQTQHFWPEFDCPASTNTGLMT